MTEPVMVVDPEQFTVLAAPKQFSFELDRANKLPGTMYEKLLSLVCLSTIFTSSLRAENAAVEVVRLRARHDISEINFFTGK